MLEPARAPCLCPCTLFAFLGTRRLLAARTAELPSLAGPLPEALPGASEPLATRLEVSLEADGTLSNGRARPSKARARAAWWTAPAPSGTGWRCFCASPHSPPPARGAATRCATGATSLPVLAQARAEVPGIVHNASQTGQTLFVEPQPLVGWATTWPSPTRWCWRRSDACCRSCPAGWAPTDALAGRRRRLRRAGRGRGRGAPGPGARRRLPCLEAADGQLELLQLRHPLLVLRGVAMVPNDVQLTGEVRRLVISGPNAGGKTVTLTAVGLSALMLRAGLPIPAAADSHVPLYASVHSAVGDAQDLGQGLSTFSAHLAELKRIGEAAGPGSLVLIDEIAADTDPREGAALATAFLEALLERGARALVTTHLEELQSASPRGRQVSQRPGGLRPRRMAPTYRLQLGASGSPRRSSSPSGMQLSPAVVARARPRRRSGWPALAGPGSPRDGGEAASDGHRGGPGGGCARRRLEPRSSKRCDATPWSEPASPRPSTRAAWPRRGSAPGGGGGAAGRAARRRVRGADRGGARRFAAQAREARPERAEATRLDSSRVRAAPVTSGLTAGSASTTSASAGTWRCWPWRVTRCWWQPARSSCASRETCSPWHARPVPAGLPRCLRAPSRGGGPRPRSGSRHPGGRCCRAAMSGLRSGRRLTRGGSSSTGPPRRPAHGAGGAWARHRRPASRCRAAALRLPLRPEPRARGDVPGGDGVRASR